jgi:hypothetical protein
VLAPGAGVLPADAPAGVVAAPGLPPPPPQAASRAAVISPRMKGFIFFMFFLK